jgi:flagellar hook-associated protein 3 FlgL
MRVTNQMMANNAVKHLTSSLERLHDLNEKNATGKKFNCVSDDPVAASLSLNLRSSLRTSKVYKEVSGMVNDWMSANDFAMQQMSNLANRAVNLIQGGLNDTLGDEERASALATEMEGLVQEAIDLGNYNHNGQYIFGGYKTDVKPFEYDQVDTITYNGDDLVMQRSIAPGQSVSMNIPGEAAFLEFFNTMIQARDFLETGQIENLRTTLTVLQGHLDSVNETMVVNGARQRQVKSAQDYLAKVDFETESLLNQTENINVAEAITALEGQTTAYQSVLEVAKRAISALNLFDYLQ